MIAFDPEVEDELQRLAGLDLYGLRSAWPERFGSAPKLRSPELLRRMLAWRLQAERFGGLDAETCALLSKTSKALPPATTSGLRLVREWKGERHEAQITDDGVLYRGEAYASLSEVARAITGVRWNGPRFFGLRGKA